METHIELLGSERLMSLRDQVATNLSELTDSELKELKSEASNLHQFFFDMQMATKLLCNSIYGGLGTPSLRYYNVVVADDITAESREVCKLTERAGQRYFKELWPKDFNWHKDLREKFPTIMRDVTPTSIEHDPIIYCDTDSNYVTFDYVFESLGLNPMFIDTEIAVEFIVYFMTNRMDPLYDQVLEKFITSRNGVNHMRFELEAVGGFGIWVAKKKYVFSMLWEDGKYIADKGKLKVVGLELKQNASSKRVKDIIETFINTIFVRKGNIDANTFFGMCASVKTILSEESVSNMARSTKLNNYDKYVLNDKDRVEVASRCPFTVRGAARYNKFIYDNNLESEYPRLKDGMFVKVYYDESGQPFTYPNDYGCPENAPKFSLDIQMEKLIFNPVRRLVDGLIDGNLNKMGEDKIQVGFKSLMKKLK